jgi:hypothetical protein
MEDRVDACKYPTRSLVPTVAQIHRIDIGHCLLRSGSSRRRPAREMDRIRVCSLPLLDYKVY